MYKNMSHLNMLEYMMPNSVAKSATTLSRIDQAIDWPPIKKDFIKILP